MNINIKSKIGQLLRDSFTFAKDCRITFDEECDCVDAILTFDHGIKLEIGVFDDMDCLALVSRNGNILGQYRINGIDKLSAIMAEIMDDISAMK